MQHNSENESTMAYLRCSLLHTTVYNWFLQLVSELGDWTPALTYSAHGPSCFVAWINGHACSRILHSKQTNKAMRLLLLEVLRSGCTRLSTENRIWWLRCLFVCDRISFRSRWDLSSFTMRCENTKYDVKTTSSLCRNDPITAPKMVPEADSHENQKKPLNIIFSGFLEYDIQIFLAYGHWQGRAQLVCRFLQVNPSDRVGHSMAWNVEN